MQKSSHSVHSTGSVQASSEQSVKTQNDTPVTSADEPTPPTSATARKTGKEPTSMAELLAQSGYTLKTFKRGDVINGIVISVSPKRLTLDIGGKSEAVVHEKEMPYVADLVKGLSPGDKMSVHVVNPENDRGQTVVSLRKTAFGKRWDLLAQKMKSGEEVEVVIKELSRGGFLIDYFGIRGFIPLSQVDPEFARLGDKAAGRRVSVKVIEIDRGINRLVLSQTSHGITSDRQKEALKQVEIGKTYSAEVTGIAPFGAFVNVKVGEASLPGLIHISEIAWEKVEHTSDYLSQGQKADVKAIGADPTTGKLTLSLKQLTPDPWNDVAKVFSIDQTVKGKVTRVSDYGVFIQLLPGIEGLIHISKMAPGEEPKVGEEVECTIEEISPEKRKLSLSLITHAKPIGYR